MSLIPPVEEYVAAFQRIGSRLTKNQRRMLEYHAAKEGPVTARELAKVVGYKSPGGVNAQYGTVGSYLREASSAIGRLEGQQSFAFASFDHPPGEEWRWHLHEPAAEALRWLGWVGK